LLNIAINFRIESRALVIEWTKTAPALMSSPSPSKKSFGQLPEIFAKVPEIWSTFRFGKINPVKKPIPDWQIILKAKGVLGRFIANRRKDRDPTI